MGCDRLQGMNEEEAIKRRFELVVGKLNERMRLVAASEAVAMGWGWIPTVSRATGISRKDIWGIHAGGYRKSAIGILIILILICSNSILAPITPTLAAGVSPTATRVYGQSGSFTSNTANNGGVSANSLSGSGRIAVDSSGNLYVADTGNNRVLFFLSGSTTATRVYGQAGSFTSNTVNNGGVSAKSLNQPWGVTLDSSGNLYVADTGNNRVLYFPTGSTTATRVYGQSGSFTSNTVNNGGVSAKSLSQPSDVTLDSSGNLYVADADNNRVLYFPTGSTTATRVYGQFGRFTSNFGSVSANGLNQPWGVTLDSSDNLYVADADNNRILYFPTGSTTATRIYGQSGSFTSNTANNGGVSAKSLNQPLDVTLDSSGNLYAADAGNNRVLYFPASSTTATRIYGQSGSFTSNTANNGGISANSLSTPEGVTIDSNGNISIADTKNNRVLAFQTALKVTIQPPGSISVGAPFSIAASLVDVGSNGVFTDFTATVSVAIKSGSGTAGATLSGTTSVAAVNGVATFSNLSIDKSGTSYILTTGSPGVKSADTNTFAIGGSLLFTPLTNPSFSFTLNGTTGTVISQHTFRVSDMTQSGTGWLITITSTQFTATGGKTLSTSSTSITQVSSACTQGQTCTLPTNTVSGYPITVPAGTTAPAAITYFGAAVGTGTGDVTLTVTFSLRVPPGTAAGTYTSTFTETLVKGQ
jgi:NHL repeat